MFSQSITTAASKSKGGQRITAYSPLYIFSPLTSKVASLVEEALKSPNRICPMLYTEERRYYRRRPREGRKSLISSRGPFMTNTYKATSTTNIIVKEFYDPKCTKCTQKLDLSTSTLNCFYVYTLYHLKMPQPQTLSIIRYLGWKFTTSNGL